MRRLALALAIHVALAAVACKGDAPVPASKTQAPVAATPADAGPPLGPALELVRCAAALPAPYVAGWDSLVRTPSGGSSPIGTGGKGQGYGISRAQLGNRDGERPRVTLGAVKVQGPLNKDLVRRVLVRNQVRLTYCYEQRLVKQPSLGGASRLTIQINPDGGVFEAHVEDRFDDALALCVKHMIAELKFPGVVNADKAEKTQVEVPLEFRFQTPGTAGIASPTDAPAEPALWTPFAASPARAPSSVSDVAALNLRRELPMRKLEACFGAQTGSLRSVMRVAVDGSVISARSGGTGSKDVETCASAALVGIKGPPVEAITEVVCDFHRGPPAPWRVTPDAGYVVIDTAQPVAYAAKPTDRERTFLVIVDKTTTTDALSTALGVAATGAASVIGLRIDAGAPLFVAASHAAAIVDPATPFRLDTGEPVRVCGGLLDGPQASPFAEADKLLVAAARRCTHKPCPAQITIGYGAGRTVGDLAALAGAARGAGFERIAFGAVSCPQ